jgi:hypothetical protein
MTMIKVSPNTRNSNGFSLNNSINLFKSDTKKAENYLYFKLILPVHHNLPELACCHCMD